MAKMRLPDGVQSFSVIRDPKCNYIYVDKTKDIIQMIHNCLNSFFSGPKRFGKSLSLSTIKTLFEGKKENKYYEKYLESKKDIYLLKIDFSKNSKSINEVDIKKFKKLFTGLSLMYD